MPSASKNHADPAERLRNLAAEFADALIALAGADRTPPPEPERLLSMKEVALLLTLSRSNVQRLRRRGEIPAIQIGHRYVMRESDVRKFLDERSSGAAR